MISGSDHRVSLKWTVFGQRGRSYIELDDLKKSKWIVWVSVQSAKVDGPDKQVMALKDETGRS